jgi:cytochrome c-type biogenesis protein CcmH/NrfG
MSAPPVPRLLLGLRGQELTGRVQIWIHFSKQDQARRQAMLEHTLAALREIVRKDQEFAHGHYFLGKLLKLGNDLRRAELAFRSAIQHDDQLIDAQRELRLMHMRRGG